MQIFHRSTNTLSRATIFGSQTVNRLFNSLTTESGRALLNLERLDQDAAQLVARVRVGGIMDELEAAVRHELGADRIKLRLTLKRQAILTGRIGGPSG